MTLIQVVNVLTKYISAIEQIKTQQKQGQVYRSIGLVIEATCPGVFVGELCEIQIVNSDNIALAEVVGFKEDRVLLMPYQKIKGISYGCRVTATGDVATTNVSTKLLGRVIDAFGNPIDSLENIAAEKSYPIHREPINPLLRKKIDQVVATGIKSIDTFITLGKGQRIGLFAGSGVGKSTLLSAICKNTKNEINVIALIGERGREVEEFIHETLGKDGLKNSIVIVATAEQPPLVRTRAVYTACAIAEYFSQQGQNVLFTMDSITRFAMALREIGLAIGEPPTVKGYTTSVFSIIPTIVERCGRFKDRGAITAIFSVLVEAEDFNDPIVDCLRAILDGHIVLTRELAERGHYPAIDVLKSVSRLFNRLNDNTHQDIVNRCRNVLAKYADSKELIELGAFEKDGKKNPLAIKNEALFSFLKQSENTCVELNVARQALTSICNSGEQ